jgi:hypothetical protein
MPFPIYATEAEVPAEQKDVYELRDAQWHPKLVDVTRLEGTLVKVRSEKAEAERKAREVADKLATLQREHDAKAKGVTDADLQKIRDDEAAARKPILDENATLKADLRKLTLTDRVQSDALLYKVMPDRIKDAMLVFASLTALSDDRKVVYLDDAGQVTALTAERFHADQKLKRPWLYEGTIASGSDSRQSNGTPPKPTESSAERTAAHRSQLQGAF